MHGCCSTRSTRSSPYCDSDVTDLACVAVGDNRFRAARRILADHLPIADVVTQGNVWRTPRPHGTGTTIATDLHRFRAKIHGDCLTRSEAHLEPCSPERSFDNRHHEADTEPE